MLNALLSSEFQEYREKGILLELRRDRMNWIHELDTGISNFRPINIIASFGRPESRLSPSP
jgi:hypothetical protein